MEHTEYQVSFVSVVDFYTPCFVLFPAQNNSSPAWEKKAVEYFKEKLKVNDAQSWVSVIVLFVSVTVCLRGSSIRVHNYLSWRLRQMFNILFFPMIWCLGSLSEWCASALPEAQQPGEVPLYGPGYVWSWVLHGGLWNSGSFNKYKSKHIYLISCFLLSTALFCNQNLYIQS